MTTGPVDASASGASRPLVTSAAALIAGLGAGTLAAAVLDTTAPVTAVADRVIERVPVAVKDLAIDLFGTADKLALAVGIVVLLVLAGVVVARRAPRQRAAPAVAVAAFCAVGQLALGAPGRASVALAVSGLVTWAAFEWLIPGAPAAAVESTPMPAVRWSGRPDRRQVLARTGVAGLGGLAAIGGAAALSRRRDATLAAEAPPLRFPPPGSPGAAPTVGAAASVAAGVEPFLTPVKDFYRIDTAFFAPRVDLSDWRLTIKGAVRREVTLRYDDLVARDMVERVITLSCVSNEVGGDLVGNARWLGVPLADLLDEAGVEPEGTQVFSRSADDWTCGFPTSIAMDGRDALVAVAMNGDTLPIEHGFPARLVVPGLYGYVSATKWLTEIELVGWDDADGYWIPRGWAKEAPIKTQSRIDVPRWSDTLAPGPTPVAGVAWAPHRGISRVEVRVDDGDWQEARLADDVGDDSWRQWILTWDATPGRHRLEVRATDGDGDTQTAEQAPPAPDGATGHHRVTVEVDEA